MAITHINRWQAAELFGGVLLGSALCVSLSKIKALPNGAIALGLVPPVGALAHIAYQMRQGKQVKAPPRRPQPQLERDPVKEPRENHDRLRREALERVKNAQSALETSIALGETAEIIQNALEKLKTVIQDYWAQGVDHQYPSVNSIKRGGLQCSERFGVPVKAKEWRVAVEALLAKLEAWVVQRKELSEEQQQFIGQRLEALDQLYKRQEETD